MASMIYSGVEQLAARQAHNLEVAGSSPAPTTCKQGGTPREQRGGSPALADIRLPSRFFPPRNRLR